MKTKKIPFLDLKRQNSLVHDEITEKLQHIFESSGFICGKYVKEFEKAFAEYLHVNYCICVDSGTSALITALMAEGIGPGDEVLVPVNTFIATAEAVSILGATPVFIDIDPSTYLIETGKIEEKITEHTRAIIPVHLYGQCADMDEITKTAKKHGIHVIEDACQAHGAEYKGKKSGSMGDVGCFSFYPGKNLGAWGEGGAIVTDNERLADKIYKIRNHGGQKKYQHEMIGGNFRMEEIQGAVLGTKLKFLEKWNRKRRKAAELYFEALKKLAEEEKIVLPNVNAYNKHVFHLFVLQVNKDRKEVIDCFNKNQVEYGIHYPEPLHLTRAFACLGYKKGDFPVSERLQRHIISLPMGEHLSDDDIFYISEVLSLALS
jgi:dTDP-4-amino-4,6-dideoxygalactose transaminase